MGIYLAHQEGESDAAASRVWTASVLPVQSSIYMCICAGYTFVCTLWEYMFNLATG